MSLSDPPRRPLGIATVAGQRLISTLSQPRRRLTSLGPAPTFDLIAVYRNRNATTIADLRGEVTGVSALWALDEVDGTLAADTVGEGAGTRFENLNRCLSATDPSHWLVVADDDFRMSLGTLQQAVALAHAAQLDISMPSHDAASYVSWDVTRCRPASMVRLTRFVDQGPMLILSPRAREAVFPLPEELGMGWGAEIAWASNDTLRLGILDAVRLRHLAPVSSATYDVTAQMDQANSLLAASRWDTWADLHRVTDQWRWSAQQPSWVQNAE